MNKEYHAGDSATTAIPVGTTNFPPLRVVERKIGRATFIVCSRFNEDREKDLVSTLARLIEHDGKAAGRGR